MDYLWLRDALLISGWSALLLAPLAHQFCWIAARTCAMILAFYWAFLAISTFGWPFPLQFLAAGWPRTLIDNSAAGTLALIQFQTFNLFVASWQVEDSKRHDIKHLWLLPSLITTALAGPLGLIIHMAIRDLAKVRKARAQSLP